MWFLFLEWLHCTTGLSFPWKSLDVYRIPIYKLKLSEYIKIKIEGRKCIYRVAKASISSMKITDGLFTCTRTWIFSNKSEHIRTEMLKTTYQSNDLSSFEQISDTSWTNPNKNFNEFRSCHLVKRHTSFTRNGFRNKCLQNKIRLG